MAVSKRWQLSPFQYKIDFALVPLLFGLALWPARISLPQIVIGALAWSFSEYAVHRFLFHRRFRKDHWAHHLDPTAYIGISGIPICAAYALLLIPAGWLGLQSAHAGFMLGYFCYLVVHYAIHRTAYQDMGILRWLTRNHELHHQRGRETNFGVTSPLWDFVFLTYSRSTPR
jgi:sterol desaturase/sphingolipid hydroxylase (fatty acid hydroxylase superfamily)